MVTCLQNFNLHGHNTFGIEANSDYWIEFTEAMDLPALFASFPCEKYRCIGQGSNMLFVNDYHGALLHSRILDLETMSEGTDTLMRIGSGISFDDVIERACLSGLWGIENLSGIPGDTGAAAVQNIGAYGTEIKDVVVKVEAYDTRNNAFVEFNNDQCRYDYRDSVFKHPENAGRYVVTHVTIKVSGQGKPKLDYGNLRSKLPHPETLAPMDVRDCVIATRNSKLPHPSEVGSAGSFFKNPVVTEREYARLSELLSPAAVVPHYPHNGMVKIPAAWLIEQCGWKGKKLGNAAVWHLQPLVLINATGKATGQEIEILEHRIIDDVKAKFGITLHPEADHIY